MRWQKVARLAIAIGVVVFTAVVFVALRWNRSHSGPPDNPRIKKDTILEGNDILQKRTNKEGKVVFSLAAKTQLTYSDGRTVLQQARLTLPDRDGRNLEIASDEMEVKSPPDKPGELDIVKATKNVRMTSSDGLVVTTEEATYEERDGVLKIPGDVQFTRGRLKGSGIGATYDRPRDVLWLLKDVRVTVAPDAQGQGAADGSAASAGFARAEHYLRMTGTARIYGDGRTLDADDITIQLSDDEKRVRTVQMRRNSRITGSGGSALNMAARDIDLRYAADGKALEQATLIENASVQLPGTEEVPGRRIAARNITTTLAPDGATVTNLTANEGVQVDLPAAGNASARRITASSLVAKGTAKGGLQTANFTGPVELRETHPGDRGGPPTERVARSQRLVVETKPGFGDLQQADFRGNVRFEEGTTTGEGPRAIHRIADDSLQLMSSPGEPGPPPHLTDARMSVEASTVTLALTTRKLSAETKVRSSLQPSKPESGPEGKPKPANGSEQKGKLPSMLKSDEPVLVNSNRLEYDGTSNATYTGDARLFQGQTSVQADTIILDDKTGNLTARGHVRTVMFFDDVDPKTKERKPAQTTATADLLVYEDGKRLATYTTGPTANAHIVGPQGDVTAEKIQLFLKPKDNELERAEADGKVTVKEGQRHATGDHLTYTSIDETYVMKGNPLQADRYAPGECTRTIGITMRFVRGQEETLVVDGIPGLTPFNTKPIPCKD